MQMDDRDRLSVIIVNYRTPDLCIRCVESILLHEVASAEDVIIVDNASGDDSYRRLLDELPKEVRLIQAPSNGGFSAGINFGSSYAKGSLLLILNPDTYFIDRSFENARRLMASNDAIGIVGLELINPDGSPQYPARRFYTYADIAIRRLPVPRLRHVARLERRHLMTEHWRDGSAFAADWVMGTGFLARRSAFDRVGGMDEQFFMYMEDVDLCARVWQAGYSVLCCPGARLVHDHQRASKAGVFSRAGRNHLKSLLHYRHKHRIPLFRLPRTPAAAQNRSSGQSDSD
jgi:GT2 family glycosyltransferase